MKEFIAVFQMSKTVIFEVQYYTLGNNSHPHFSTSAAEFCRNKCDFRCCGQAQNDLLKTHPVAKRFYQKWDVHHLKSLTSELYAELQADLENLKNAYNYMYKELDESEKPYNPHFPFYHLAEWSKQNPNKKRA